MTSGGGAAAAVDRGLAGDGAGRSLRSEEHDCLRCILSALRYRCGVDYEATSRTAGGGSEDGGRGTRCDALL